MAPNLGQLFLAEGDRVFGFLLARCGSRALAEDLTAEVFLDAGRRFRTDGAASIDAGWLFTVARRRLIDHWRRESSRSRRLDRLRDEALRTAPADGDEAAGDGVAEALASLGERHRAALVLRYLEDFSVSEVADALGLGYKATESVLSRARAAFARAYEQETR